MTRTTNYDLIVVEGSDKVNLLTQMNPNTEKIDEVMKTNEKSGVQVATELFSGTVHAITRTVKSASMFKFTAVSNYTAGDTFTVDGVQVTALLTSGEALGTGAYIIGSEVLCSLKDTLLTVYTQGGIIKLADDSKKLGGNLPEYYAKQSELDAIKQSLTNKNKPTTLCRINAIIYDKDSPDLYTEFTCEQNPNDFNLFTAVLSVAYNQTPVYIKEWYSDTEDGISISSSRTITADKHFYNYYYAVITWERNQTAPYKIKVRGARQFFIASTDRVSVEKIGFESNLFISVLQGIK